LFAAPTTRRATDHLMPRRRNTRYGVRRQIELMSGLFAGPRGALKFVEEHRQ
jgi:hypothetical protein